MGYRFGAEDEHAVALRGDGKSPADLAVYLDRRVRAGRKALAAADTGLILDLEQQRLIRCHSNGIGGADTHTGQACHTKLGVYDEIQGSGPSGGGEHLQFDSRSRYCQGVGWCKLSIQ